MFKRFIDIIFSLIFLPLFFFPMLIIVLIIYFDSGKPFIYWSKRVGKNNNIFNMPKFRTMNNSTPDVATHLLKNSDEYLTGFGLFMRKFSIDEIPQLYSILIGDMSVVGPRPALYNQDNLIKLRTTLKIDTIRPGLTGLAQINGRDSLSIEEKVNFDYEYLKKRSLLLDIKIFFFTIYNVITKKNIRH